ncbi:ABC transporter permease [Hahella ganghwensis]|uniref:ABC transporter permease n=1 Tax=Hahella ganghwensis TaxID=286420 RepID=UPI00037BB1E0|nr:ABC transporter permease [Hahella ganghwensis]
MLRLEKRPSDSRLMAYMSPVMAIILTLISGALLFAFLGQSPTHSLYTFFISPLTDLYGWSELGVKVAPLMLCALGLTLCFRAKVWNIGAEGQFIIGGLGGGYLALQMGNIESAWVLPAVILFGALCGLGWAALAALLKTRFNCNEVLTTIMLNYIALNWLLYSVHGPLKDPEGFNFPESALFSDFAMLPPLFEDYRVSVSLAFAMILMVAIWTLLSRTMIGFQISVLGEDAKAAQFAGFRAKRLVWLTLLICGALAGFAGVSEVSGQIGQLTPYISPGYGYSAIIVVFLGRMHPVGILLGSMILGLTFLGGEMVQMELAMPKSITGLFQGMLLFYLLACDLFIGYRIKLKSSAAKVAAAGS